MQHGSDSELDGALEADVQPCRSRGHSLRVCAVSGIKCAYEKIGEGRGMSCASSQKDGPSGLLILDMFNIMA